MRYSRRVILAVVILGIFSPTPALADVGLPTIFGIGPVMLIALLPVIGVEAFVLSRWLDISAYKALAVSGVENVVSTVVGVPLAWFFSFFFSIFSAFLSFGKGGADLSTTRGKIRAALQYAPWLPPSEGWSDSNWLVSATLLCLLFPCFGLSLLIESSVAGGMLAEYPAGDVTRAVVVGNVVSYGLLALVVSWTLAADLKKSAAAQAARVAEAARVRTLAIGFDPESLMIAVTSDGLIRKRDLKSAKLIEAVRFAEPDQRVEMASISPTGDRFAWVNHSQIFLRGWSAEENPGAQADGSSVSSLCISIQGQPIFACFGDEVFLLNMETHERTSFDQVQEFGGFSHLALSKDGAFLAAAGDRTHVWETRRRRHVCTVDDEPNGIAFGFGGEFLAAFGGYSGSGVRLWDVGMGQRIRTFDVPEGSCDTCAFIGTCPGWLAACSWDGQLSIWDINDGVLLGNFPSGLSRVDALAASPDGASLLVAGEAIVRWQIEPIAGPQFLTEKGWSRLFVNASRPEVT